MAMVFREPSGSNDGERPRYSIATLVTNPALHAAMMASFKARGFDGRECEFLWIDNGAGTSADAYKGLNLLLDAARGDRIILCHQDVRLVDHGRADLDQRLAELALQDPHWALAGNAGGTHIGRLAMRISDPHGANRSVGALPARVMSLDENFIVVRREARLGLSRDLEGFHLYGTDLCLVADVLGWSAFVIDFHLEHLSPGRKDASFHAAEAKFRQKWSQALRPRFVQTTCTLMYIAAAGILQLPGRLAVRPLGAVMRRVYARHIWTGRPRS